MPALVEDRVDPLGVECRVQLAIGKYEAPFWVLALVNGIMLTTDWCGHEKIGWTIKSVNQIAGATLVDGDRKVDLKLEGREYEAPIGDKSWMLGDRRRLPSPVAAAQTVTSEPDHIHPVDPIVEDDGPEGDVTE